MDSRETNVVLLGLVILLIAFSASRPVYLGYATKQCADGDGYNLFYHGKVVVPGAEEAWDVCVDETVLQEFFCEGGELQFAFASCPSGCEDGACTRVAAPPSIPAGGETYALGTSGDQVELNEYLGDVQSTLTESELDALQGGQVSTRAGLTEYHQYLRFNDDINTGRVVFAEDEDNRIGDVLYFRRGDYLFEYELEFEDGLQSSISGTRLDDLDDRDITILGRDYTIAEAEKNGNMVTLRLVGGDYSDVISEGETKTYTIGGKDTTITLFVLDDVQRRVTLKIDGKLSKQLREGDVLFVGDVMVGIGDLYVHESLEGTDFVKLFVSARTLTLKDDASDSSFSTSVEVDGTALGEGQVKLRGTTVGSEYKLLSITYRLQPDTEGGGDLYIPPGRGARDYLDAPEAFLAPWDIQYGGLEQSGSTSIVLDPTGTGQYDLKFTNRKGQSYAVGVAENSGGSLVIRDGGDDVHFLETASSSTFSVDTGDYFIVTSENDKSGITNVLRYQSIDTAAKTLHFDELAEGGKSVSYTGTEGTDASGDLIVSGKTYRVFVGGASDYALAIDLDSDGGVDGSEAKIITDGGGIFDLGSSLSPGASVDFTLTTDGSQFDENATDETVTIRVVASGSSVDVELNSQSSLSIETENSRTKAMSRYGVYLEKDNGNPDRLAITYPLSQAFGVVKLVFAPEDVTVVSTSAVDRCGNHHCDEDEGFMNCPKDCQMISFEEEHAVVFTSTCGDGVCGGGEVCPQDCVVYEEPAVVQPARQGFWARLWQWIVGLFT